MVLYEQVVEHRVTFTDVILKSVDVARHVACLGGC